MLAIIVGSVDTAITIDALEDILNTKFVVRLSVGDYTRLSIHRAVFNKMLHILPKNLEKGPDYE